MLGELVSPPFSPDVDKISPLHSLDDGVESLDLRSFLERDDCLEFMPVVPDLQGKLAPARRYPAIVVAPISRHNLSRF